MTEEWKAYDATYEVSNYGRVRNSKNGRIRTIKPNKQGYLDMRLYKPNSHLVIHRAVATLFIPNPNNKPFINHIDGNKHNNLVDNLEWCTRSENEKHAWKFGLKRDTATKGELHGMHKLSRKNVEYIRNHHVRNGGNMKTGELARIFNVNSQTITDIVSKRIWRSIL